jgi:CMD domain protein
MSEAPGDVVDEILGIELGSALAELRAQRPEARAHTQGSYRELFDPQDPGAVPLVERFAIALRAAAIHQQPELVAHYRGHLLAAADHAPRAAAPIPAAELIAAGTVSDPRLAAILRHTELLATGPGAATPDDLAQLRRAGLGVDEIVIVSQTIAFISFQARVVAGLSLIAHRGPGS